MGATTAEIIFHAHNDLVAAELRVLEQQRIGVHYHTWSAKPTLDGAIFEKGILQRMQFFSLCQTLDSRDFLATNRSDG